MIETSPRPSLAHHLSTGGGRLLSGGIPLGGALLATLLLLRRVLATPGFVVYRDLFPGQLHYPYLWHPQGSFLALENYKFVTFTGLFLPLRGLGPDVYEKAVYAAAVAIAFLTLYTAAYRLLGQMRGGAFSAPIRHAASALAALTYVANPAAANIFCDFSLFVGYAFVPLWLLIFMEMLAEGRPRGRAVIAVAVLWWLAAIKAHWILFGALSLVPPLLAWGAAHRRRCHWRRNLASTVAITLIYLLASAYWLIPFAQASGERFVGSTAPMTYETVAYLSYAPLSDTLRLLGLLQAWPYVPFAPPAPVLAIPWTLASWAIPALAAAAIVWFRRHWQIWALALFAAGGILLVKGVAPPLGGLYSTLVFGDFTPPALRWLFRVSSKWNVFLSLGYSWLVAFGLAELLSRVDWRRWRRVRHDQRGGRALLALATYLIALPLFAWPAFTGDFNGALRPVRLPDALVDANSWLARQPGDFKVHWIPVTNGRNLSWNPRPSGDLYTSLSSQPSIGTNWNRHPVLFYSYAYDALADDRISSFGKLLSPLNTRYVAFHDDIETSHIHTGVEPVAVLIESGEEVLTTQLAAQRDMRLAWEQDFISIYETAAAAPPLFVPQKLFLSTADLTLLTSLSALEEFEPAQHGVLFDGSRGAGTFPSKVDGLILGHDAADHLAFSMLPVERMISPADATLHGVVAADWSRLDIYQFDWQILLRDYGLYTWGFDYGQGMVAHAPDARGAAQRSATSSHPVLRVPVRVPVPGRYHLWVRHLLHPWASEIRVSVDGGSQRLLTGQDPITRFVWDDAGTLELSAGGHVVAIENREGLSAVNALVLLTEAEMAGLRAQSSALAAAVPNIYLLEAETDFDVKETDPAPQTKVMSAGRAVALHRQAPISTTLDLLAPGGYTVAVRASLPSRTGTLTVTLGTSRTVALRATPGYTRGDLEWLVAGPIHLDEGTVPIRLQASDSAVLDAFMLYTSSAAPAPEALFEPTAPPAEISYTQIDPTRYRVLVRAQRPFMLALAETYDPLWVARGPDLQVSSVPLFGVVNGFFLSRSGDYELTIEYQPQQGARFGAVFSIVIVMGLVPVLWISRRGSSFAQRRDAKGSRGSCRSSG